MLDIQIHKYVQINNIFIVNLLLLPITDTWKPPYAHKKLEIKTKL